MPTPENKQNPQALTVTPQALTATTQALTATTQGAPVTIQGAPVTALAVTPQLQELIMAQETKLNNILAQLTEVKSLPENDTYFNKPINTVKTELYTFAEYKTTHYTPPQIQPVHSISLSAFWFYATYESKKAGHSENWFNKWFGAKATINRIKSSFGASGKITQYTNIVSRFANRPEAINLIGSLKTADGWANWANSLFHAGPTNRPWFKGGKSIKNKTRRYREKKYTKRANRYNTMLSTKFHK